MSSGLLAVEEHLVGEAGTAARTYGDAQTELRLVLGLEELLTLVVAVSVRTIISASTGVIHSQVT